MIRRLIKENNKKRKEGAISIFNSPAGVSNLYINKEEEQKRRRIIGRFDDVVGWNQKGY